MRTMGICMVARDAVPNGAMHLVGRGGKALDAATAGLVAGIVLPDYPATKQRLAKLLDARLRAKHRALLGPLAEIPPRRVFEGENLAFHPDGKESKTLGLARISAQMEVSESEIADLTLPKVLETYARIGQLRRGGSGS